MNRVVLGMRVRAWLALVAVMALAGTLVVASLPVAADKPSESGAPAAVAGGNYAKTLSAAFRQAADRVLPSVVLIRNVPVLAERSGDSGTPSEDDLSGDPFAEFFRHNPELRRFFRDFGGLPSVPSMPRRGFRVISNGSGVIIDPSGIVLTNNHVVEGAQSVMVRLHDGREMKGIDIKRDPRTDLAILRLDGKGPFPAARLGNSDAVGVGDWVLALGEPFGLEGSVTAGIISAKGRGLGIAPRESFLQTDAAINPGNSGGPLVNIDGEVIGINTAISSRTGGYQGVGFAIPVNLAKWVADQLVQRGTVQRAYLGVAIQPVTHELAEKFQVPARKGVLVGEVRDNTPAAKAGMKPGDVVVEFNGQPVNQPSELQGLVEQTPVGSTVPVRVLRDGKTLTLNVTCLEQPKNYGLAEDEASESGGTESSRFDKLGLEVGPLTPEVAERLGVQGSEGVVITRVEDGSLAELAGLRTGMVITEVNRKPVNSVEQFRAAVGQQPLAKGLLLLVRDARGTRYVVLRTGA